MPLRAKIHNRAFSTESSKQGTFYRPGEMAMKEVEGDDPSDVMFDTHYGVRTIELNRRNKMNALSASMARKIIPRLLEWMKSDLANIVIISGTGTKAFCAGGDVAALATQNKEGPEGHRRSHEYFGLEYQLDHLVSTYTKPYIAYMDGVTMGGGAGLSVHAPIRIATERTVFAFPETKIGFFPDVGASFFLSRLDGSIGTYLALTGKHIDGLDAYYAGIATHYIDSSSLPSLTARLAELQFKDFDNLETRLEIINATIAEFDTGLPFKHSNVLLVGGRRRLVDRCFSQSTVQGIIQQLREDMPTDRHPEDRRWALQTLYSLLTESSPTSLRVALRLQQLGKDWSIAETFQREYELAGNFMAHSRDFISGVSARLISKPAVKPKWEPEKLRDVNDRDIAQMLHPEEGGQKLELINTGMGDYKEYPHSLGLPREKEVEALVRAGNMSSHEAITSHLLGKYNFKVGVREKVHEILRRCTISDPSDPAKGLSWRTNSRTM